MENVKANIEHHQHWPLWRLMMTGLNLLALIISIILSWHYLDGGSMAGCSGGSPCEQVLSSRWSTLAGVVPVSGLAMGVYLAMLAAGFFIGAETDAETRSIAWNALLVLAGSIAGSAIWFIIVQKWFIGAFCYYCMTIHITGLLLSAVVIRQAVTGKDSGKRPLEGTGTENTQTAGRPGVLTFRVTGLILIGLVMSGMVAAGQVAFTPKAAYQAGRAQDPVTDIDYRDAPIIGSPDAPYVVKLLFDYECPHCQKIHFMLGEAVRRYAGKLAFVLCPTPLNTQCNPYVPRDADAFKNSCELAKVGLAVWLANPESYPAFDNWMFSFESGDRWRPRSIEDARAKAMELVGTEKFNEAIGKEWIAQYMQDCVQIYGKTVQEGKGGVPKLVFGSQWVIPEPNNEDDFIRILQQSLGVAAP